MSSTYTLALEGETEVQKHHDAEAAAQAFHDAPAEKRPRVIREDANRAAKTLATTYEQRRDGLSSFTKAPPTIEQDKAFREAFDEAERRKQSRQRAPEVAQSGQTYQGRILAVSETQVLQETSGVDGKPAGTVVHQRNALSGLDPQKAVGKVHQISYPHGAAGLVKEVEQGEREAGARERPSLQKAQESERNRTK